MKVYGAPSHRLDAFVLLVWQVICTCWKTLVFIVTNCLPGPASILPMLPLSLYVAYRQPDMFKELKLTV